MRNGGGEEIINLLLMGEESHNSAPLLIIPILRLADTDKTSLIWLVYHDPIVETTFHNQLCVDVFGIRSPESLFERIDEALRANTLFDNCKSYLIPEKKNSMAGNTCLCLMVCQNMIQENVLIY